jgi:uncharacterized protein YjiS (DUF1127 family)
MAFYDTTRPAAGPLGRAFATIADEFRVWREARVNRAALAKLSDRELSDIGLLRSDLDEMSRRSLSHF